MPLEFRTAPLFEVHDEIELLALWRLVAEAKFAASPDDIDLWGSPYVHRLAQKIADSQLSAYESRGDIEAATRHRAWVHSVEENVVWPVVVTHLKNDATTGWWKAFSEGEKVSYVKGCLAPFELSAEKMEALIRESEA